MSPLVDTRCDCPTRSERLRAEGKVPAAESLPFKQDPSVVGKVCPACEEVVRRV